MELNMGSIGERIKQRRTELGLKQSEVYKEVGISSGRLSDLEGGKHAPSLVTLYRLSIALNCSIDWIITGKTPSVEQKENSINGVDKHLLDMFHKLSVSDQEEILEFIELKIRRQKGNKKASDLKSSHFDQDDILVG